MDTKDFESKIESGYNDMVFSSSDGYKLTITIENRNGRQMSTHLIIEKVAELKAVIASWERLYYSAAKE